jgi:hypothetical protein
VKNIDGINVVQFLGKIPMVRNTEGSDERGWKTWRRWFDIEVWRRFRGVGPFPLAVVISLFYMW